MATFTRGVSRDNELENGHAQDVSVYDSYLIQGPFRGIVLDQGIQIRPMLEDAHHQGAGKIAPGLGKGFVGKTLLQHHFGIVISDVNLVQSLQGHNSSAMSDFHYWYPVLLFC